MKGSYQRAGRDGRGRSLSKRLLCSVSLPAFALLGLPSAAHAQDANRNWDANGTTVGNGGTGTWNTTGPNWSPNTDGTSGPYAPPWDNTLLDNAIFGGAAGTVTLGVPITVHNITFNTANYTLTGNTLTLGGTTPTITVNSGTSTVSSIIAGSVGLAKAGAGTLSLTGANTFTGNVVVNTGALSVGSDAALGNGNTVTLNDGTSFAATGALSTSRQVILNGAVGLSGPGVGSALITGNTNAGALSLFRGVVMSNDANTYTGTTITNAPGTAGTVSFTSVGNTGIASSLGASGEIFLRGANNYIGDGDTSNRIFRLQPSANSGVNLINQGTGTLALTGIISLEGGPRGITLSAESADLALSGTISGTNTTVLTYTGGGTARTITLGGANTYTGANSIGAVTLRITTLADRGAASSLGTNDNTGAGLADILINGGVLDYRGSGDLSNRTWEIANSSSLLNNGTGGLTLTGAARFDAGTGLDTLTLGGSSASQNTLSGALTGTGSLVMNGAGTWVLGGANTYTGTTTVQNGTLRAGSTTAFGAVNGAIVNGGVLDLNGFDTPFTTLEGSGGTVALGGANLTLNAASGSKTFAGALTGVGGSLTKLGASTLTLTGQSTYTGPTTIGGGTLALNFTAAGAPASNIIGASSPLVMSGGTLNITGDADGSSQTFGGLTVTAGNNKINATAGAGALTVDLGAITRSGGLIDFTVPTSANILTSNADGALGGWATITSGTTVKTTDYAQVVGGAIVAFTAYVNKDNAATWLDGEILSDEGGAANTPFTGTVSGSKQIGGLKYTVPVASTVNIGAGQTLGVDGTIIVSSSVGAANQTINGGSLTGGTGGSTLGVLNNSTGASTFTIGSTIVDNGGATSFAKSGTGLVTLNGVNTYTGGTAVSQGTLSVTSIGNGGAASAIGASSSASSNLVIEGATLRYTGGGDTSDRGFTLVTSGAITGGTIDVTQAVANLAFSGVVTSPDNAGLTKLGAGTLTLSNDANDYSGVTTIGAGTLSVDALANGEVASGIGAASSASSNLVLQGGGELEYTGGTVSIDRGFNLAGPGAIDVTNAATTLTVSGIATGGASATLSKNGAGTLVLSGVNTFTAGGFVNAGTLRAGSAQALGIGGWTVASGATLDLNGFSNTVGALTGSGAVNLGAGTLTISNGLAGSPFSGILSGSGGLTLTGGTQVLSGCGNTYTGVTNVFAGVLSVGCIANGGVASDIGASGTAASNLSIGGTLSYTGGDVVTNRGFTAAGGTIEVTQASTELEFTGVLTGSSFVKSGAGTLILSGTTSAYNGPTRVFGGTLRAGSTTAFGGRGMILDNFAGVVLDLNNFDTILSWIQGSASTNATIRLGSATLTLNNVSGQDFAGAIVGTGGLIKSGNTNTQILRGCLSSYTGSTSILSGTLTVDCLANGGSNSSIGASSAVASSLILNGGNLLYQGAATSTDRQFTLGTAGGTLAAYGTGPINFTSTAPIALTGTNVARTLTLAGINTGNNSLGTLIADNGTGKTALTKTDAGTWILTNPNSSYTGITTISGGVLGVDKLSDGGFASSIGASAAAASNLIIGNGSTLRYTGTGDTTNRLFTLSSGVTFIESSGTGAIVFTDTGPVTLQTANVARTIALGGTNTGNNTLAGSIGNAGTGVTTLAKNDAGTWVLTGTHTYTGPTNINAGILNIGNGGTSGSITSATVNNFGTLGFNRSNALTYAGTITGTGTVQQLGSGTTILMGTSNYTGGTTISAGTLQLGGGGATGSIVGNVTNNGTLTFNRNNAYTFAGTISGSGQLTQIGSGTTVLTGTNSYSGGTSITAGTLQVSSDANLGAASGGLSFNGGTLRNTASMMAARAVTLAGAGTFLTDPGTTLILTGAVAGAGTLTKTGTGTLTLAANNSYTGLTTISAGTLRVGNSGTTGSVAGNVLNNSALVFDRSNSLTYGGTITGSGTVTQAGSGTTILTGANSYAGATDVTAGTLRINGDQSGATGLTTVFSGATLGGSGTVGGSVLVQNGGTLAPGNSPGVLTINGDLSLSAASILDFEFGQANVAGGPLNDLINVGGNLTFDGTINVTQSAGGGFGPGVYRIINYAGALTDNGLTVGTLPSGTAFVQTAIANQVNLVNTAGLTLNFWDGPAGPKNDGLIQGGTGTWRVGGGSNDWTEVNGAVNADYAQDSFAIFQGTGGTVTVDNSGGNVLTSDMQFTVDGYTIAGGPLTLTGADALVRVGDGSAGDAGLTATIGAALTGATQLVKTDGGTLVLSGANSYTGGTAINGGTLEISSNANLGDAAGGLSFSGGTLHTTASLTMARNIDLAGAGTIDTDFDFDAVYLDGVVSGGGALIKRGIGNLVLRADNSYTGGTTIEAGTLVIGNGGTAGWLVGDIVNNDSVLFVRSDNVVFGGTISGSGTLFQGGAGVLTLTGDNSYTSNTRIGGAFASTLQLGNGGTTGSVVGDIENYGTLIFNRSNEYGFAGTISGAGAVRQEGTGTTILTADNSYTGSTVISSGTLLINGNQTAAVGTTNVLGGGTLGGTGTIGGDVFVGGGATLTPGDATGPGTLTISGNLGFSPNAVLAYGFGQSNLVGGPLNDLTQVAGDLTLDGTIDVTVSPGGSFGPGLYRVISYGGALSDQGLLLGTMPAGSTVAVQTSIDGQVNLVNAAGGTFNFWDGAAPANESNNSVDGGDGTWQNSSGNNDWTTTDGAVSGAYTDGTFAIFAAAAGTVDVDNSLGAVTASGLQFATDGYTITGQDLTLVGPQSIVRVGDGTAAGLGYTATIEAALTGSSQLVKADLGTLVLTGANSYAGGTLIDVGTLQIGAGGTSGSIAGDVVDNGTLVFARADDVTFGGTISGTGAVRQSAGTLTLTGNNSYTGITRVTGGTLLVNGDQSAATGATAVAFGATLGGTGTIGGEAVLADSAHLAPGSNGVGKLTINGNLSLSPNSVLDFEFGQANVAGGSLNDLVDVGGDLVLDGTINVSVPTGGSFGPGIYRVFNYAGTLIDNGLTLGALPGGSAVSVQTAIGGQVNLVNTAGLTLSFWDGGASPKNDGTINGGDGVWRIGGGFNNWTTATGSPNADYAQNGFAIFSAAPGTVTIDDVGGAVQASGLQFASDGYTITGDALALTGAQAIVQVGDGSAAGAGMTATIDAELTGTAGLVKTDAGTLVLTGTNSYAGGTAINGGTLRIASDANLGDAAGGLRLDGGTLNTTATTNSSRAIDLVGTGTFAIDAATALNLDGVISGAGALVKQGTGILTLTADNSYAGGTTIAAGSLQVGNGGTTGSVVGDIVDNGELILARSDGYTISGTISGTGAVRKLGGTAILTADNSYTGGTTNGSGILQLGDGGTTGGIVGDIVNAGTLRFNRSNDYVFSGAISDSGGVEQAGSGTTILTGRNSYAGATTVTAGTLLVNGDQSAARGLTSVASGATLGGTGIIGGDASIANGGTLAAGSNGVGALTINGSLVLDGASQLAFELGQANVPGGPLNDLVNVGGDLTLDGTISVTQPAGGSFGPGVYRVINYAGTLTDNGLAIGSLPSGSAFVQTAIARQVNLVNTAGLTLNFWDGDVGPKNDGAINGGNGVWQVAGGRNNWTGVDGSVNADYAQGSFAIFQGSAGTVTVDNGLGAVTASGMQFATGGYTITGNALTLVGLQSVIRVGDGTIGGAGYTATIDSELTGDTQLVKTDAGTLVLTGTNSYTGGSAINGGVVRIASDANLGAAAGGLSLNGGTLNTTADLASGRAVELAGAGTLLTDDGTTLTLTGATTGAGSLTKNGAGTLVLSGTGGHTGATNVSAGTLLVNGDYSGATGATTVASGASFGGTGTIGGNVALADGAILTPGAGGAGTLTIGGDLSLAAGTTLAYEFGEAGVAGGTLNDLVNVAGDLTLDGTINVSASAGGGFGPGVYRVFNYGGRLTDHGLAVGTLPGGSATVQTAIAGQVNLINAAGLALGFWDGAAGPKNNGVVNGGSGTWQNGTGNDNWTNADGTINAGYADGTFAVFGGTGGTVTVDNGLGQVGASGMQFAANGYTIAGGGIALTGPQSTIRVGDGSTAGAGVTATVNAALSGDTQLVKADAGTLVLGGTNSYTGGTAINGGTLQIAADANLGAASGNVTLDGGTLATSANVTSARGFVMAGAGTISTAAGTTFTLNGTLSGSGALRTAGTGTLLLTGDSSGYTGATTVSAGTLAVNGSLCGDVNVLGGGRVQGTGTVCSTNNAGTIAPGNSIGTLTVAGTYTGQGGTLEIETALGGDASPTDRLVVTNGTAGSTHVTVINQGGLGGQTVEGIKIVDVTGGISAGTFALNGDYVFEGDQAVIAGAYGYRLVQGGVATPTDGDWYLRSSLLDGPGQPNEPQAPLYQPGVPVYEAYGQTLLTLTDLGTMQQRIGNRQWATTDSGTSSGIWGRMQSGRSRPNASFSTSLTDVNTDSWKLEIGADQVLSERSDGATLVLGVLGGYGEANASLGSIYGNGSIRTKAYSAGATLTWFGPQGFYVDGRAQVTRFDSKLRSSVLGTLADGNDGTGLAYSVEVGKRAPVGRTLSVTPQIQMTYQTVGFDGFTDPNGAEVSSRLGDSLKTRWGIAIDRQDAKSHLYGIANLSYEWLDGTVTDVSGTPIARENHRLWGELGIGGSVLLGDRLTLYTEASANTALHDFGNSYSLKGTAGLRLSF